MMKTTSHLIAKSILLTLIFFSGALFLPAQNADELGKQLVKQLQDKLNANIAAPLTALYTKDQIFYMGGGGEDVGFEALQKGDQEFFSEWKMTIQLNPIVNKMLSKNHLLQFGKSSGTTTNKSTGITFQWHM